MILNTRPRQYKGAMLRALASSGHDVIHSPVLESRTVPWPMPEENDYDALIVTSQFAVEVVANTRLAKDLPIYAVGSATAATARAKGLPTVVDGGGTAETLIQVVDAASFQSGLYLSARDVSCDLSRERPDRITRCVVYDMLPADSLSQSSLSALEDNQDLIVPFYSPRSFQVFESLVTKHGLVDRLLNSTAVAIHPRVFHAQSLDWGRKLRAGLPEGPSMVDAILCAA